MLGTGTKPNGFELISASKDMRSYVKANLRSAICLSAHHGVTRFYALICNVQALSTFAA